MGLLCPVVSDSSCNGPKGLKGSEGACMGLMGSVKP